MESKSKRGDQQYGGVWLGTRKQCLAASTALLMLPIGTIIDRHDYDQPHLHVESELTESTNMVNSYSSRIPVDSGATAANIATGTIGLLATLGQGINVVTS